MRKIAGLGFLTLGFDGRTYEGSIKVKSGKKPGFPLNSSENEI